MIYPHKELLWSNKKEWTTATCDVVDEHQNHYAEQKDFRHKRVCTVWFPILWSARQNLWKIRTIIPSEEVGIDWKAAYGNFGGDENGKCSATW